LLSPCEGYFWRMEESFPGYHRITAVFRLDGCMEERIFNAAVDHLQRRHPKLRAEIVRGPDGRLRYHSGRAAPPIRREIKDYEGQDCLWREEARRLSQIPIHASGPFIAITVFRNRELNSCVLIVNTHHGIADGISAMMLGDDLLTEYARIETQSSAPARPALTLVYAGRAKETGGWRSRWWLLRRFVRLRMEERRARQTRLPESPQLQPVPQWEHWCFSPEETAALVQRCRRERASVAGALVAAACCGLMKSLPDEADKFLGSGALRQRVGSGVCQQRRTGTGLQPHRAGGKEDAYTRSFRGETVGRDPPDNVGYELRECPHGRNLWEPARAGSDHHV
jgi:hypothetical protein